MPFTIIGILCVDATATAAVGADSWYSAKTAFPALTSAQYRWARSADAVGAVALLDRQRFFAAVDPAVATPMHVFVARYVSVVVTVITGVVNVTPPPAVDGVISNEPAVTTALLDTCQFVTELLGVKRKMPLLLAVGESAPICRTLLPVAVPIFMVLDVSKVPVIT